MNLDTLAQTSIILILLMMGTQAKASGVYITEWMYSGNGAEYIELTNLSGNAVDFTGWSYDDSSAISTRFDLSGFGIVADGESVILAETTAAQFRHEWNLDNSIKVLGGATNNLRRNDTIDIFGTYDGAGYPLIDRLVYRDQNIPGSIWTKEFSGRPMNTAALGTNMVTLWTLSVVGDEDNTYLSTSGDTGSPGTFNPVVPIPPAVWLFASGIIGLVGISRR